MTPIESRIGRLAMLVNCGFKEAAMIKDNPEYNPVLKQVTKQTFNEYWKVSRLLVKNTYKLNLTNQHADEIEEFTAMLYEAIDQFFKSKDPGTLLSLMLAYNAGDIDVQSDPPASDGLPLVIGDNSI